MAVSSGAVVAVGAGVLFAYGGLRGKSPLAAFQAVIQGQDPTAVSATQGIATPTGSGSVQGAGGDTAVALASQQEGKPYVWDTPHSWKITNPPTFDCSGLYGWCIYQTTGKTLPHYTVAMRAKLKKRSFADAQPGDAVFFHTAPGYVGHVGIYDGAGGIWEAPAPGIPIRNRKITMQTTGMFADNVGVFPGAGVLTQDPAGNTYPGGAASVGGNPAANQAIARSLLPAAWRTQQQWDALVWIWDHESSWDNTAQNPSGAYGIPQALPASKLPKAGRPPSMGGTSDPTAQIRWGLNYIRSRYGNPVNAKAFWQANGWY